MAPKSKIFFLPALYRKGGWPRYQGWLMSVDMQFILETFGRSLLWLEPGRTNIISPSFILWVNVYWLYTKCWVMSYKREWNRWVIHKFGNYAFLSQWSSLLNKRLSLSWSLVTRQQCYMVLHRVSGEGIHRKCLCSETRAPAEDSTFYKTRKQ